MTTYYDILGVEPTASADEIKAAYQRLAMQFHPDKTPGANKAVQRLIEDKFKEIQEAYDTLKDDAKRAEYDAALEMLSSEEYYEPPPPPPPNPRYCPKCRKHVPTWATPTDKFCTFCGASLQSSPPPPNQESQQPPPPPPPQASSTQQSTSLKIHLIILAGLIGAVLWGAIAAAIGGLFPNLTDDAARRSALFLVAAPFVLWVCVVKARMKWPLPALLPSLMLLFIAAVTIGTGQKENPQHQPSPAIAVQRQTSEVARTEVQSPIQKVTPQPGNRSAGPSKDHTVPVSAREAGCAVTQEDKKLGFVPDSCKSGETWVEAVKGRPRNKQREVDTSTTANYKPSKPGSLPQMTVPLASPGTSQVITPTPMTEAPQGLGSHPPTVGKRQSTEPSAEPTHSRLPAGFFTIGSSKADVLRIQGTPTSFTDREWSYGLSSVYFSNGRVVSWQNYSSAPLKVKMLPAGNVGASRGYITVGSTKDEVLAVQGTPTHFSDTEWGYGLSSVYFSDGRVASWQNYSSAPLNVRMLPVGHVGANRGYFTVGSTKDEVLAIQGTPTHFSDTEWGYGLSSVYFSNGRVVSWQNYSSAPLKVRMPQPEP